MKISQFFLPLALIFSLQILSVYADNSIVGTWTIPERRTNKCIWCCAPVILSIQNAGSDRFLASFIWGKSDENQACIQLFSPPNYYGGSFYLDKSDAGFASGKIVPYGQSGYDTFYFHILNDGKLNVYNGATFAPCDFVMNQKQELPSNTLANFLLLIPGVITAIMIVLRIYYNNLRQTIVVQQLHEITKGTSQPQTQLQTQIDLAFSDAPVYIAPGMYASMYQNQIQQTTDQNSSQLDPEMGANEENSQQPDSQTADRVDVKKDEAVREDVQRPDSQANLKMNASGNKTSVGGGFVDNRFEF